MLLGIRTDSPVAEFCLYDTKGRQIDSMLWEANRELARLLLVKIDEFLEKNDLKLKDITGLFVYTGPGSFTGLRIGITVMNTLAYSLNVPIVGRDDDSWDEKAVKALIGGSDEKVILPFYGSDARITAPRK